MYTLKEISYVLGCEIHLESTVQIHHLLTDSRSLLFPASTLFFALQTNRNDGQQYIQELYLKGVRAFVIHKDADLKEEEFEGAVFLKVTNSLMALQKLAAYHRKHYNYPVIGITGSNGKTVVKEWLNQLLQHKFRIVRSPRSFNSQIGVPLSIWAMNDRDEMALLEAGISTSGEMEKLEKMILPTIGVLTNIGPAHSEGFASQQLKTREKLRLFRNAQWLVYGKDDPSLQLEVAQLCKQREADGISTLKLFNWSAVSEASLQILSFYKENGSTKITASYSGEISEIVIPFMDEASIENALHCWSVLLILGLNTTEINNQMACLEPLAMRLELKKALNGCILINDSYSADLHSLKIALDFLVQQRQSGKRSVILSDILQSGKPEKELYEYVAHALSQRGINRFIGVGERLWHHRFLFSQIAGLETLFYKSTEELMSELHRINFKDELILLKGARVFSFEKIDRRLELLSHQTVLEINLNALVRNLKYYQQQLKKGTKVMAMVKAFAYGAGSFEIAQLLQFHQVDYLAVAYTDEAVELRKAGIRLPIMIMNPEPAAFDLLLEFQLEPDLYAPQIIEAFGTYLEKQGVRDFPVHIELETGMNRLGFSEEQLPFLMDKLRSRLFKVQSVFSHLAASEDPLMDDFTKEQSIRFERMGFSIASILSYPILMHLCNTSGIARHPDMQYNMVRLGIGLYGTGNEELEQVLTLRTTIAQIKTLHPGDTIGYGRKGRVDKAMKTATIRIGYADGYPRRLSNGKGKVLVNGKQAPVLGLICMDMTMIDITGIEDVKEGDDVVVFGASLPLSTVANWAGTIAYELMAGVSQRVKRVYYNE